ncbi:MAG: VOC family protein [Candidatus Bathyarchaeota archaeon]|nr:VOC family protein [Candidatus Bathyarchaeota archaeon]MDH5494207.1 VOC family protein [Candidatus Bathyarchaeota archaeon]
MIRRINHVAFAVSDLKETARFYEEVLGLRKTGEWANYVIFDVGGVELAFGPGGKKGGKGVSKEGVPDIFMLVDDVDGVYERLRAKGVRFVSEPKDQYWGGRTAAFLDPDENKFILVQRKEE